MFSLSTVPDVIQQEPVVVQSRMSRVEAGLNTSTVALRVVGGNGKGTQFLGDINTGTWPSRFWESRI
jgi:hypothetical protein